MGYRIAVVGATGNVGREMLSIMAEREFDKQFKIDEVIALASSRSVGKELSYGEDKTLKVKDLAKFDFTGVDIALASPGAKVSAEYAPKAAAKGCVWIDNTSFFRTDPDIPLVVPEVNAYAIKDYKNKNIIANPNCSTIQMVVALKPLHEKFKIKRIVVSTYQSVSGAGKEAMDELFEQTRGVYMAKSVEDTRHKFTKQIAFNVIPHIDVFMDSGMTKEEWKMVFETNKILDPDIKVCANCCRVPVFIGHGEFVNIETEKAIDADKAREVLTGAPGVSVIDHRVDGGYVTPAEVSGEDNVFVSRIRVDESVKHGLSFWCAADNLRKGAALNAAQIAEIVMKDYLKK